MTKINRTGAATVIRKYANRRLYNTGTSAYVTLDDLAAMVRADQDFVVEDARTQEDITHQVLTQIIFELENKGRSLLPVGVLRQLIRFYGAGIEAIVPSYLEHSIEQLAREQEKYRSRFGDALAGPEAMQAIDDQIQRNGEVFRRALRMFLNYGAETPAEPVAEAPRQSDLDALKAQLDAVQRRLDQLVPEPEPASRPS